jgi:hypothetical protein
VAVWKFRKEKNFFLSLGIELQIAPPVAQSLRYLGSFFGIFLTKHIAHYACLFVCLFSFMLGSKIQSNKIWKTD